MQKPAAVEHFSLLDGMRGVGALVVVAGHAIESVGKLHLFPHVQAGVDLFFALSGFVIAHAYQPRMERGMSLGDYTQRRLIRLYPLVPLAVAFGATIYLVRLLLLGHSELLRPLFGSALLNAVFLPSPLLNADAYGIAWAVNPPLWSLTSEAAMNVLFGVALWKMRSRNLVVCALLGAVAFAWCAFRIGETNIGPGWYELDAMLVRPVYPFCAGILLWRITRGHQPRFQLSPAVVLIGMVLILAAPSFGRYDLAAGLLLVWIGMPLVLYAGAFLASTSSRTLRLLGDISYPVYLLHFPLIKAVNFATKRWDLQHSMPWGLVVLEVVLSAVVGYAAFRLYDEPVRNWLTGMAKKRAAPLLAKSS
jgi:peptidoglycan/LPS O-acetylase OafA/YrhL